MNTLRNIAAFVAAFLVGSLTMFALHELHMTIWPEETMPASTASTEEFRAWMETLSMPTMIAATVVHWLGTSAGVAVGMLVAARSAATGQRAMWPAYVMGAWFFPRRHCQRHSVGHAHVVDSHRRIGVPPCGTDDGQTHGSNLRRRHNLST